jgi:hypothetical protein
LKGAREQKDNNERADSKGVLIQSEITQVLTKERTTGHSSMSASSVLSPRPASVALLFFPGFCWWVSVEAGDVPDAGLVEFEVRSMLLELLFAFDSESIIFCKRNEVIISQARIMMTLQYKICNSGTNSISHLAVNHGIENSRQILRNLTNLELNWYVQSMYRCSKVKAACLIPVISQVTQTKPQRTAISYSF